MSTTDADSFAPNPATRGNGQTIVTPGGSTKTSLSATDASTHLISGASWSFRAGTAATVTYAFRRDGTPPDDSSSGFSEFSSAQITQAEKALQAWSDVANIKFTRVADADGYSDNATILFGNFTSGPAAGFTIFPGSTRSTSSSGDVWINGSLSYNAAPTTGNYGGQVLVHEIGHAIGLSHPSDYDVDTDPTYAGNASYYQDSNQYTVMSYFDESETGAYYGNTYSAAPLLDDITAAQRLYGANMTTRTDDTTYGFNSNAGRDWFIASAGGPAVIMAVWDAGGTDTFDFSGYRQNQTIDLRAGDFSNVGGYTDNVVIAYNVTIENAIGGSGADQIIGNAAANVLTGNAGNDTLYGEAGADTLRGGDGADTLDGGSGANVIDGGAGNDTLLLPGAIADYTSVHNSDGSWTVSSGDIADTVSNVETVSLLLAGTATANGSYSWTNFTALTQGAVAGAPYSYAGLADFTGDGRSDILFRNTNGAVSEWQSAGSSGAFIQSAYNSSADSSWKIVETFDWNGDGKSDILWRNTNGTIAIWNGASGGFQQSSYLDSSVGNGWSIAATGDINGDGKDDILWRYQDGTISVWSSAGTGFYQNSYSHASVGTSWKVEGLGDFNGDGRADILWRNDNGTISIWTSTGTGFAESTYLNGGIGTDWHIEGIADFNGDKMDDLLWRNDNGTLSLWYGDGSGVTPVLQIASPGSSWHIAQVGDFNGDGRADLLWVNDNGAVSTWQSNGSGFDQSVYNSSVATSWSVASHDFPL